MFGLKIININLHISIYNQTLVPIALLCETKSIGFMFDYCNELRKRVLIKRSFNT